MKVGLFVLALGAAIVTASGASAHHSFSMYDRHRTVTLSGTVKQYIWMAPHVTISVVSEGARNNAVTWSVEGSSPAVLSFNRTTCYGS